MRKHFLIVVLSIVFFALVAGSAMAATEWHTANATKIAWDAVTKSEDGSATFDPAEITYQVYVANAFTDPDKGSPVKIGGPVSELSTTITLNAEGRYLPGVSAIRTINGVVIGESVIAWSDEQPSPWGIQFYEIPPSPTGLRKE